MYTTKFLLRLAPAICVAGIGLMALLVLFGNVSDYWTNYQFVKHVMKMDTIFPESAIQYRNIHTPIIFHGAYWLIILLEAIMVFCCLKGSWLLFKNIKSSSDVFHSTKNWAVAGIIIGICIWFGLFQVIGGEWFAMWQSEVWNGLNSASRIVNFLMLTLILLHLPEKE
ncbi:MAG: DUF2165 domain-containing protein [Ginsengibacter sp.]|jgi:predicted small integral membrane protein